VGTFLYGFGATSVSLEGGNPSNEETAAKAKRKDGDMDELTFKDRELVALGAALGSNCTPCIEHHVTEARKAGLSDAQISAAIQLADRVRKVPAAKALDAAFHLLDEQPSMPDSTPGCQQMMAVAQASGCCS
jgi:AhpD family alkylhydroperoxidase